MSASIRGTWRGQVVGSEDFEGTNADVEIDADTVVRVARSSGFRARATVPPEAAVTVPA